MATLKNHPGMWLNDSAAAALNAFEDKYGIITINSAGRYEWEQQNLIDLWNSPQRPSWLYKPANPAKTSPHVRNGGEAIDIRDYNTYKNKLGEFGFNWYGPGDPVHFNHNGDRRWLDAASAGPASALVRLEQAWLNSSRNAGLEVDGIRGPKTIAAYKAYQTFLRAYGYTGAIDGEWGPGTQAAHAKYYAEVNAPKPNVNPQPNVPSVRWQGIQEMLKRHYGYTGPIDGIAGKGTITAFQNFLAAQNYSPGAIDGQWGSATAKAAQRWLKARWGYGAGIDGDFGPGTRAAWARAEAENARAF